MGRLTRRGTDIPLSSHRSGGAQLDGQRAINVDVVWAHIDHPVGGCRGGSTLALAAPTPVQRCIGQHRLAARMATPHVEKLQAAKDVNTSA